MSVFVTATTQRKRAEMERVFGTDQIPVTHRAPSLPPAGCLAYTLDHARLHWMQVNRLVYWLARRDGLTPAHARVLVTAGLPIAASEVSLVQEIEQDVTEHPAFASGGQIPSPPPHIYERVTIKSDASFPCLPL